VVASAAPLLTACDLLNPKPDGPPPPDPLTDFYSGTVALAALYDSTVTANPNLAPIREAHRAHAAALAAIMKPAPSPVPSTVPSATVSSAGGDVRAAEQQGYQKAVEVCLSAPSNRATLLGEIAAARACHLEILP
jgi:hypothetical protein